ncbi:MAG: glycoside hydrolase family 38 C-terminal domain-containing protein [Verrucomicrobiae bacterium]
MSKQIRRAHYILSSHWDREWYQTFQDYRARLVGLMDRVLLRLESGVLRGPFTCDGQSIILDDYLEIRPERAESVRRLLGEGKLVAGPWYVMPDEFLVSGESLIRNLRKGNDVVRAFGGQPSRAGFVCDLFGHCSQLPQILRGFGVRAALVWRGVPFHGDARFHWEGADHVAMPSYRFGKSGYCDYANKVRHAQEPATVFDPAKASKDLMAFLQEELKATGPSGPALVFDGGDHLEMDPQHYQVLWETEGPCRIEHSTLDNFIDDLLSTFGEVKRIWSGELREPALCQMDVDQSFLIPGVGSSRQWIKRDNAECQTLLCAWAEPFSALATLRAGAEWPGRYLEVSWEWLLKNHPHDSICGCSIDQVHEDMKYRFGQSRQIAARLADSAREALTASVEGSPGDRELRVSVFNPLAVTRTGPMELVLEIPADWPEFTDEFGFENKPAFRIFESAGQELPYQRISQNREANRIRIRDIKFPEIVPLREVRVALELEVPALGYTTLTVRGDVAVGEGATIPIVIAPTRHPSTPGLAVSSTCLENEFLRVEVGAGGTLTLLDKSSGEIYPGLLELEDAADIGDGWYHHQPVNDQKCSSKFCAADVVLVSNGPLVAELKIRTRMMVPESFDARRGVRSGDLVELLVETSLKLRCGQKFLEVSTRVVNPACDHRLRMLFPSGSKAKTFLADAAFDVVERPVALREDRHLYREMEIEAKPQQSWTAVHDTRRGLAVVGDGALLEAGVRDTPERPILLTLYRSTGRTVMTQGQPDGQLLGHEMTFRYRIAPLRGAPDRTALFHLAQDLAGGIEACQMAAKDVGLKKTGASLPAQDSLIEVTGEAIVTSAKLEGKSLEVRLFNPYGHGVRSAVRAGFSLDVQRSRIVDFLSQPVKFKITRRSRTVGFLLRPKQILTVSLPVSRHEPVRME